MDPGVLFFLLLAGGIFLAGALIVYQFMRESRRREAFWAIAHTLGLEYTPKDHLIPRTFFFLEDFNKGESKYAMNVLKGVYKGHKVLAFDYHYVTRNSNIKGHSHDQVHLLSCFILLQEKWFPELRLHPETWATKLGQMMGFEDIDFESHAFSEAFVIRSKDKKFAYDIIHTRMMEYLLQHRDISLEIENHAVAIVFQRRLAPEAIPEKLDQLVRIRELFPAYLYAE